MKSYRLTLGLTVLALTVGLAQPAMASSLLPGFSSSSLGANDDGSVAGAVPIGFTIDFYSILGATALFLNNNGNVTFTGPMGTFTPFPILTTGVPLIAPFFADVDTRSYPGNSELMTYGTGTFDGRAAFGVNWGTDAGVGVDYFGASASHTNSNKFQLVLVDRSDTGAGNFDFMFNYALIQWEAGTASDSSDEGCLGFPARAGYSDGDATAYELAGSGVAGSFIDSGTCGMTGAGAYTLITHSLNSDVTGRYLFNVRGGTVREPPSAVPEPASLVLLGSGLLGIVAAARRRARKVS